MIKFRKDYHEPSDFKSTNAGKRMQDVYVLADEKGSEFDIKIDSKKFDLQEYINSFEPSVNINNIVERFTSGDFTAIPKPEFSDRFIDISNIPENIHEINESYNKMVELFNSLPEDKKSEFSNVDDFVANIDKLFVSKNADIKESNSETE